MLITKWETDFITFSDLYGYTVLGISDSEKWKAHLNIMKLKQSKTHGLLQTMGLYMQFDLFKFYEINFCFPKIQFTDLTLFIVNYWY